MAKLPKVGRTHAETGLPLPNWLKSCRIWPISPKLSLNTRNQAISGQIRIAVEELGSREPARILTPEKLKSAASRDARHRPRGLTAPKGSALKIGTGNHHTRWMRFLRQDRWARLDRPSAPLWRARAHHLHARTHVPAPARMRARACARPRANAHTRLPQIWGKVDRVTPTRIWPDFGLACPESDKCWRAFDQSWPETRKC